MDDTLKKIIAILLSAFVLSVAYYGSYLPLRKSQAFIDALRHLSSARSLKDFEDMLSVPLDMASPIGQEELIRNSANVAVNILQQNRNPALIADLMAYIENYYAPIVSRHKGMSYEQDLYILGTLNELAFSDTVQAKAPDVRYLQAAHKYYAEGVEFGPNRPQTLYGMFDVLRTEGDVQGAKAVAEKILSQWPTDERTKQGLAQFLSMMASTSARMQNAIPVGK